MKGSQVFMLSKLINYHTEFGIFNLTVNVEIFIFYSVTIQTVVYFTQIRLALYYLSPSIQSKYVFWINSVLRGY